MKVYSNLFDQIISPENLFSAWEIFKSDKRNKLDVARFEYRLEENIFRLHWELKNKIYRHGSYHGFWITDPKQRHIHKALVRDRVLHHAIFSVINPIFEPTFISRSFSCRIGFGTHRGVAALEGMVRKVSRNGTSPCFVLKCDIRKFFDSVNHSILISILERRIKDENAMWLLREIVESYPANRERESSEVPANVRKGIPIGNLTSQLFANIYMNEFDQFVKHGLKVKYYARYTDDFVIVSDDRRTHLKNRPEAVAGDFQTKSGKSDEDIPGYFEEDLPLFQSEITATVPESLAQPIFEMGSNYLDTLLPQIREFLKDTLALELHPNKVGIRQFHQGVDFLGYVVFPHHRVLRTKTRRRIFKKFRLVVEGYRAGMISRERLEATLNSYLGVLSHANAERLAEELKNILWF